MIVSEDDVHAALEYLNEQPHPEALAEKDLADAEIALSFIYATVYAEQSGSIKDKQMACDRDSRVGEAKAAVAAAKGTLAEHRARVRGCRMCWDIWKSEGFTARAAERVR